MSRSPRSPDPLVRRRTDPWATAPVRQMPASKCRGVVHAFRGLRRGVPSAAHRTMGHRLRSTLVSTRDGVSRDRWSGWVLSGATARRGGNRPWRRTGRRTRSIRPRGSGRWRRHATWWGRFRWPPCARHWTTRSSPFRPGPRCRRCGTGSTSCRCTGSPSSGPTATPSAAGSSPGSAAAPDVGRGPVRLPQPAARR